MPSPKQAAIKCAEECVKLANQRFHLTQSLEAANAKIKQLEDANQALIVERDALLKEREETLKQEPVLKVYRGEICSMSKDDDQSYGMWCEISESEIKELEGIRLYAKPMPPAIPEGYVIVPVEPTKEMTDAAHAVEHCGNAEPHFAFAYKAMIAASQKGKS